MAQAGAQRTRAVTSAGRQGTMLCPGTCPRSRGGEQMAGHQRPGAKAGDIPQRTQDSCVT